ncbi:MAG: hypothetical protein EZS28_013446 [Streblomastix strix]|uniref:Uncharacterized protein n=1 Tax=Streblomastix strix TaxID=222440 RepID=A0A5J4W816_9EUKA|nr:MAG: hypothetical protein EZS28_013446 [Streblomastix strix]
MKIKHGINDTAVNKTDEEIGNGSINQTSAIDIVAIISNIKKRGMADWTNPIYKSLMHTRRSSYHVHESCNEQTGKECRMEQPDQVIEESVDGGRVMDNINKEQ